MVQYTSEKAMTGGLRKETMDRLVTRPRFHRVSKRKSFLYPRRRGASRWMWMAYMTLAVAALFAAGMQAFDSDTDSSWTQASQAIASAPVSTEVDISHPAPVETAMEPGSAAAGLEAAIEEETAQTKDELTPAPHLRTVEVTLEKGDNLFNVLSDVDVSPADIGELVTAARPVHDLARLKPGQICQVEIDDRDGRVKGFFTDLDTEHRLIVKCDGSQLVARKEAFEFAVHHSGAFGEIDDSLFMAADKAGLPPSLTMDLAEIFAWDIDFHVDIRKGDNFQVLFEKKYCEGRSANYGRILAAGMLNQGKPLWAFYFEGQDGKADYYTKDGQSLRKAFLKSPLKYKRISSGFSYNRYHPILKRYRPHLGIDYAAPLGTAVRALGDGKISFVGRKGGFGRYIEVRHNETYTTTYGHLHRYAKGIKNGKHVTQGQVIGYVGSTGRSTGPHLDFRLLKNGQFINPLKVNFPDADPVSEKDLPAFREHVAKLLADLDRERNLHTATNSSLQAKASSGSRSDS